MTHLQEMLERAAEVGSIGFEVDDVRRRVRRRRRLRRVGAAACGLLLLVAGGTAVMNGGDSGNERVDATDHTAAVEFLEGRWEAIAYSAVVVPPVDSFLQFNDDGTLVGYDGCNSFRGDWVVTGNRLGVSDLTGGRLNCPTQSDTNLLTILQDNPTLGTFDRVIGTLKLESDAGFVAFEPAATVGDEAGRTTEVTAEVTGGGTVTLTFRSPRTIQPGTDRELVRWTSANSSDHLVGVWEGYAIEGLPSSCDLQDVRRWEDLAADVHAGRPPDAWRHNIPAGTDDGPDLAVTAARRDVPDDCTGDYILVLVAISESFADGPAIERVPLSIR